MDNLPMKIKKHSIFNKFKLIIKNLFNKNNYEIKPNTITENEQILTSIKEKTNYFKEDLRKDIVEKENRAKILNYVDNDINIIYNLSTKKLKELIQLYDEEIQDINTHIKQLKNSQ